MIKSLKFVVILLVVVMLGILVSSCFNLQSLKITLEVIVKDSNGKPIEGAKVEAQGFRGTDRDFTDPEGRARLELLPGIYNITATRDGYIAASKSIRLLTGANPPPLEMTLRSVSGGIQDLQEIYEEQYQQEPMDYEVMGVRLVAPGNGDFAELDTNGVREMELSWEFNGNYDSVYAFVLEIYKYEFDTTTGEPTFTVYERIETKNLVETVRFGQGIYIWHVFVKYNDGTEIYSEPHTLTVGYKDPNDKPPDVVLIDPSDGKYFDSGSNITFKWRINDDNSNEVNYELYVVRVEFDNGATIAELRIDTGVQIVETEKATTSENFVDGPYFWFVIARDFSGNQIASEAWTFPVGNEGMISPPEEEGVQYQYPMIYIYCPEENVEETFYELPVYMSFSWDAIYFTSGDSIQATMVIDEKDIKVPIDKITMNGNYGEYSDENWYIYKYEDEYGGYLMVSYYAEINNEGEIQWKIEFSDGKVTITKDSTFTIRIEK